MTNAYSTLFNAKYSDTRYYEQRNCFWDAYINQQRLARAGIKAKIVCGSLGFRILRHVHYPAGDHWLFGMAGSKYKYFVENPTDSHVWVEDEDGGVYDFFHEEYLEDYKRHGLTIGVRGGCAIDGIQKSELRNTYGMIYEAADRKTQDYIWSYWKREIDRRLAIEQWNNVYKHMLA
jgi:hypothetical protein